MAYHVGTTSSCTINHKAQQEGTTIIPYYDLTAHAPI